MQSIPADTPGIHIPPPLIFVAGLGPGLLFSSWIPTRWLSVMGSRMLGWLLIGSSAALAVWSFVTFFRAGTTIRPDQGATVLTIVGPYRFTRNPMYLSLTMLYIGLAILWQSIWALILLPLVLIFIDRQVIAREELHLERRFGADYLQYRSKVRRCL
jgi:protein-S-isoprenylcysteine O-methyltransferase Ste14